MGIHQDQVQTHNIVRGSDSVRVSWGKYLTRHIIPIPRDATWMWDTTAWHKEIFFPLLFMLAENFFSSPILLISLIRSSSEKDSESKKIKLVAFHMQSGTPHVALCVIDWLDVITFFFGGGRKLHPFEPLTHCSAAHCVTLFARCSVVDPLRWPFKQAV